MISRFLRNTIAMMASLFTLTALGANVLIDEEVRGNTRVCYYRADDASIVTKTVPASDPCPVNFRR